MEWARTKSDVSRVPNRRGSRRIDTTSTFSGEPIGVDGLDTLPIVRPVWDVAPASAAVMPLAHAGADAAEPCGVLSADALLIEEGCADAADLGFSERCEVDHAVVEPPGYVLADEAGRKLARLDGTIPSSLSFSGRTLRAERFASGWSYAFVPADGRVPVAWFDGRSRLTSGGRIVIAPDREYELRTRILTGRRWELREDGVPLAIVAASPGRWEGSLNVTLTNAPSMDEDQLLLLTIACMIVVLEMSTPETGVSETAASKGRIRRLSASRGIPQIANKFGARIRPPTG